MIGQEIGLPHLLPVAIERLKGQPLAEGDYYPGDLLCSVLRIGATYWRSNPDQRRAVAAVAEQAIEQLAKSVEGVDVSRKAIHDAYSVFARADP